MADKKISELTAITGSATAADDYFILVDTSGAATKKISRAELNNAIEADVLSTVNIDGGTIDGTVIGGSAAAAASLTTLNTSGAVIFNDAGADVDFRVEGDADPNLIFADASVDGVVIGGSIGTQFNAVGGAAKLTVIGSSASTNVLGNTLAAMQIVNTDQTALNTAGLHFSRADTDDSPNYAGASIVTQFGETQATGQYPSASLSFLTATAQNSAPSLKMTLSAAGFLGIGKVPASKSLELYAAANTAIRIQNSTTGVGDGDGFLLEQAGLTSLLVNYEAGNMLFLTSGAEKLRITSDGKIGIGTTSPITLIEATGDTPQITITSSNPLDDSVGTEDISSVGFRGQKNNLYRVTARVQARQDGTWSTGTAANAPTALEFYTQSSGSGDDMATPRMTLDNAGNVGIGRTVPKYLLDVGPDVATSLAGAGITLFANSSLTSSIGGVLNFRPALGLTASEIYNLSICAYDHGGDGNADGLSINGYDGVSFCTGASSRQERMRIDTSGNVGIGTSSPVTYDDGFQVFVAGNGNNFATIQGRTDGPSGEANGVSYGASYGTKPINYARIRYAAQGSAGQKGLLAFHTKLLEDDTSQPLERMRIEANGNVLLGTTNASFTAGVGIKFSTVSTTVPAVFNVFNTAGGDNTYHLYNTNATNNGYRFYVNANGGIYNYSANNSNLSDIRSKTNIELSGNYLSKICAIPVKLFNYKDEPADKQRSLGVIAQDVEAVAPELVNTEGFGETPEDGIPLKSIYTTDMQYALMKCIQEQQALIEALETRITALEG